MEFDDVYISGVWFFDIEEILDYCFNLFYMVLLVEKFLF